MSQSSDFRLLMFLIDYGEQERSSHLVCVEHLEATWTPHVPIKLPRIAPFTFEVLQQWIANEMDILPFHVTTKLEQTVQDILEATDNGIPLLVLEHICTLCGVDWYEGESQWLAI